MDRFLFFKLKHFPGLGSFLGGQIRRDRARVSGENLSTTCDQPLQSRCLWEGRGGDLSPGDWWSVGHFEAIGISQDDTHPASPWLRGLSCGSAGMETPPGGPRKPSTMVPLSTSSRDPRLSPGTPVELSQWPASCQVLVCGHEARPSPAP